MTELKIAATLKKLGIPANLSGYHYLKFAINATLQNHSLTGYMTKQLYPMIAKHFGTTPSRVERAIRHAIEVGWSMGSAAMQNELFQYTISPGSGRPTNGCFIATIAEYIHLTKEVS